MQIILLIQRFRYCPFGGLFAYYLFVSPAIGVIKSYFSFTGSSFDVKRYSFTHVV